MKHFCLKYTVAFLVLMPIFAWAAHSVYADRTINSVTLNGASSTSVSPSDSITVSISVTTNTLNDKNWRATSWDVSGATCVNHADHNGAGTYSENFTVTAPSAPGTYSISFIAYANSGCTADPSATYTLTGGITVVGSPTPTPTATPTPEPGSTPTPTPTPTPGATSASSTTGTSTTYYPSVSLNTYTPNPTNKVPLTFLGLATIEQGSIAQVEYTLTDGGVWIPAQPVDGAFTGKDEHFTFTTAHLAEGTYTIKVRAKSGAGTYTQVASYATGTATIATTPPRVTLDAIIPNPTKNQTPTLTGSVIAALAPIASVEVSIDNGASWRAAKKAGSTFSITLETLEDGNYPLIARGRDSAGNIGQSETQTLVIDTIPPIIGGGMQSIGPQILTPDRNGVVSIVAGTETTIAISMKGGVTQAYVDTDSGSFPLTLQKGTHLWVGTIKFASATSGPSTTVPLTVRAMDGAGNETERLFNTLNVEDSGVVEDKITKQAIADAEISLYIYEAISAQWILWEAQSYGQRNPQKADDHGSYSFMVPTGTYYLEVHAAGYTPAQSEILTVSQTSTIHNVLSLAPKPTITFTLPILGAVVFTIPTFSLPDTVFLEKVRTKPASAFVGQRGMGDLAPVFFLSTLENKLVTPTHFRGKKLVLSFLAPWSALSMEQVPFLSDLSARLAPREAMLAVVLQESASTVQTFMQRGAYQFPVVSDGDGTSAGDYHVSMLPHHVFIDTTGRIVQTATGVLTDDELLEELSRVP